MSNSCVSTLAPSYAGVAMPRIHAAMAVIPNDKRVNLPLPCPARRVVHS
jgi:hypothetical protein